MGQFIGGLVENLLFVGVGVYLMYFARPVLRVGVTTQLKKSLERRWTIGVILIILGIALVVVSCFDFAANH